MDPLATEADIVARLGRALTAAEQARIDTLLADASASVRRYIPQDLTIAATTERLQVRNGIVRLPQRPVISIASVTSMTDEAVLYQWDGFDIIRTSGNVPDTFAWEPFSTCGVRAVNVTYTHGYSTIPADIIGVVCSIVMRSLGRDPVDAGITTESIQGYSYSFGATGAAGALGMLQAEKDILDVYKRVGGNVRIGP